MPSAAESRRRTRHRTCPHSGDGTAARGSAGRRPSRRRRSGRAGRGHGGQPSRAVSARGVGRREESPRLSTFAASDRKEARPLPGRPERPATDHQIGRNAGYKKPPAAAEGPRGKAQKPEIRLTPSAIAGHRAGQKAPLEQLTKEHFAKTQEKKASRRRRTKIGRRAASRSPKWWSRRRSAARVPNAAAPTDRRRKPTARWPGWRPPGWIARNPESPRAGPHRDSGGRGRSARPPPSGGRRRWSARHGASTAAPRKENVVLELPCTVRSFSEATASARARCSSRSWAWASRP